MNKIVDYDELMDGMVQDYVLIDVRSPKEYKECTIPGAVNIPLFTDEERAQVGTTYTHVSVDEAKIMGVDMISRRLPEIFKKVMELQAKHKNLVFFCARGGMRSGSICALLNSLGVNAIRIRGGYKGYRKHVVDRLPEANKGIKYVVLHGGTGTAKTKVLKHLESKGYDVLDLEGCANHRGSLLGSVGLSECNSQKKFESLILESLEKRKGNVLFIEGESKRIGRVLIPECIFHSMMQGCHVFVDADLEFRANNLVSEYVACENCNEEIADALDSLKKYIGERNVSRYKEMLEQGKYEDIAVELMVKYYDPMYENEQNKLKFDGGITVTSVEQAAEDLIQMMSGLLK